MRLIDADALINNIERSYLTKGEKRLFSIKVRHAPTIAVNCNDCDGYEAGYVAGSHDNKRPLGEWIEEGTEIGAFGIKYTWNKCNKCGWSSSLVLPKNFCPNCGAEMEANHD